jgi:hypothetical protein
LEEEEEKLPFGGRGREAYLEHNDCENNPLR